MNLWLNMVPRISWFWKKEWISRKLKILLNPSFLVMSINPETQISMNSKSRIFFCNACPWIFNIFLQASCDGNSFFVVGSWSFLLFDCSPRKEILPDTELKPSFYSCCYYYSLLPDACISFTPHFSYLLVLQR